MVSESSTFPDLVYEWYKPAIAWAESTGVVDGYEDGTFQPDQPSPARSLPRCFITTPSTKATT